MLVHGCACMWCLNSSHFSTSIHPLSFPLSHIPSHFFVHTSPLISSHPHPHPHPHPHSFPLTPTEDFLLQEQAADIKILSNYVSHLRRVGKGHGVWHFDRYLYDNRGALGYDGVVHHLGGHGGANGAHGGGHGGGGIA